MSFNAFKEKIGNLHGEEDFLKEDDYLDWRFAMEAIERLLKQKRELEHA